MSQFQQRLRHQPSLEQDSPQLPTGLDSEWLAVTLYSIGDAVIAADCDRKITFMNPVAEALTGWTIAEAKGQSLDAVFVIINETTRLPAENPVTKVLRDGVVVGLANHTLLIARDGTERAIDDSAAPIRTVDGELGGVVLVFRDVTPQRQAERRRSARLAVTNTLAQESNVTIAIKEILAAVGSVLGCRVGSFWRVDPNENVLRCEEFWNEPSQPAEEFRAATREFAFSQGGSLPGRVWKSGTPVWISDIAEEIGFLRAAQAEACNIRGGFACPVTAGERFLGVMEFFSNEPQQPDADLLEMMATVGGQLGQYIERREAEKQLQLRERELADFFDNANVGLHWLGPDGMILHANQKELDLLGYRREEYIGRHFAEFYVDPAVSDEMLNRLRRGETLNNFATQMRAKDGSIREVLTNSSGLFEDGRFIRSRCFLLDVTEQKRAERALRESEERFRTLADAAPVLIWMSGRENEGIYFNQTWLTFTGKPAEEQMGNRWLELVHPDDRQALYDGCMEAFRNRTSFNTQFRMRRADGEYRWLLDTATPRFDPSGQLDGFIGSCIDITDHVRAAEVQERLAAIVKSSDDAIVSKSLDGIIQSWNDGAERIFGYTAAEAVGQSINLIIPPELRDEELEILARLRRGERVDHFETVRVSKQGRRIDVSLTISPIRDNTGRIVGASKVSRDITIRKRSEEALRESEERFRLMANSAPVLIWISDTAKRCTWFNRPWLEFTGRTMEQDLGKGWVDNLHPDDRERCLDTYTSAFDNRQTYWAEFRIRRHDGEYRWLLVNGVPRFGADGEFAGYIGSCVDVTDRKQTAEELRRSEERYRAIVESQAEMVCRFRPDGTILFVNGAYARARNTTPEALVGANFWEFVDQEDHPAVRAMLDRLRPDAPEVQIENRFATKDGTRWTLWTNRGLNFDADLRAVEVQSAGIDITERKQLEISLQFLAAASKSLSTLVDYKSTLQQVARLAVSGFTDWCSIDMLDEEGVLQQLVVTHRDPAKAELAEELARRYPPSRGSVRGSSNVLRTGEPEMAGDVSDELLTEIAQDAEHLRMLRELKLKSYMSIPLAVKEKTLGVITFVSAESGRRYGPDDLALAEDLAHRAAIAIENALLYQEVRQADRRKDEFLAMLAHELRNPLAPIRSGLDILGLENHNHRETILLMQEQLQHLVRLVDDLLDVSRIMRGKIELRKERVELSALMTRSAEAIRAVIENGRQELIVTTPQEDIWLDADPVRLVQVIENLLNNAAKYTDFGGRIELSAALQGGEAVITVRDTGIGIEPELLPNVFELFTQSSRSLDRAQGGLGIGLTLAKRLVELHQGTISADSAGVGQGSTFTVRLPTTAARTRQLAAPPPPEAALQQHRILVVDDNVSAARMLCMLLSKLGAREVEMVHDGASALEMVQQMRPEVVLLDIGMPDMDGYQVAKIIRNNHTSHEMLLVALTGYGQEEDRRRSKAAGFDRHLVKPVEKSELEALLSDWPRSRNESPHSAR